MIDRSRSIVPRTSHLAWARDITPKFRYPPGEDAVAWARKSRKALRDLLGRSPAEKLDLDVRSLWAINCPAGRIEKIQFASETDSDVLGYVCLPRGVDPPYRFVICLQGHATGMHLSIGLDESEMIPIDVAGDRDFAISCMARGMAALCIEQRAFGQRMENTFRESDGWCFEASLHSLLLGRTMMGERVYDVERAVDYLATRSDVESIGVLGNSNGGAVSLYAAAVNEQISFAIPSSAVCGFKESLLTIRHCIDNYIPGIMHSFDIGDIAALIAPRPLVIVNGTQDTLFPIDGVISAHQIALQVYEAHDAKQNCELVVGRGGHRFYADQAWQRMLGILDGT